MVRFFEILENNPPISRNRTNLHCSTVLLILRFFYDFRVFKKGVQSKIALVNFLDFSNFKKGFKAISR